MVAKEREGGKRDADDLGEVKENERRNVDQKWNHWLEWQVTMLLEEINR